MALEFPSADQFAASQGVRPFLAVIAGVVAALILGKLFSHILQCRTANPRRWSFPIVGLLLIAVPLQTYRFATEGYERVASDWRSAALSSPLQLFVEERLFLDEEWISQRTISAHIDREQVIAALHGCTRSRRPAKWFRGRRVLVRLADRSAAHRELAMTLLFAAPNQLHADLPDASVTFTATADGGSYDFEPKLELECPQLSALLLPLLPGHH